MQQGYERGTRVVPDLPSDPGLVKLAMLLWASRHRAVVFEVYRALQRFGIERKHAVIEQIVFEMQRSASAALGAVADRVQL